MRSMCERGFSLLSVLIAVMIVGIMASIAVPRFSSVIATANKTKILADLTVIDTAVALYRTEKGSEPKNLSDLSEYIADLKSLKPPQGNIKIGEETVEITATSYTLTRVDGIMRATCNGYDSGSLAP